MAAGGLCVSGGGEERRTGGKLHGRGWVTGEWVKHGRKQGGRGTWESETVLRRTKGCISTGGGACLCRPRAAHRCTFQAPNVGSRARSSNGRGIQHGRGSAGLEQEQRGGRAGKALQRQRGTGGTHGHLQPLCRRIVDAGQPAAAGGRAVAQQRHACGARAPGWGTARWPGGHQGLVPRLAVAAAPAQQVARQVGGGGGA